MRYRRVKLCGHSYFFTVNLANRHADTLTRYIHQLRRAFSVVKTNHPFQIDAMVVLPDHLHCIWTMPADDADYSLRWGLIKSTFSRCIGKDEGICAARLRKRERGIWQQRFWEHCIRSERDMLRHIEYIHINPIKHGYVEQAVDWPFSSIHKFVKQ